MNPRLLTLVEALESAVSGGSDEAAVLGKAGAAMGALVAQDDWLPATHAVADPLRYQQHLLYADPGGRFSVVSFVWGPGQRTPIHDHTVWGVIGMLRGQEISQGFRLTDGVLEADGPPQVLRPGDVAFVSPRVGDIHRVNNGLDDAVSISIHAYGTDIGSRERHVFDPGTHAMHRFVSGYSSVPAVPLSR